MFTVGCHLSFSKGFAAMGEQAAELEANTFQFFSGNPRGYASKPWDEADVAKYNAFAREHNFGTVICHAPYVYNLCAAREDIRALSFDAMVSDLQKLEVVENCVYNFHPGSHVGQGTETGIALIADALSRIGKMGFKTPVLLETMAGKGSEMGRTFEELAAIIAGVENNENIGVCLDTCHVFDGGYDIVNGPDEVLRHFDEVIGLSRLKAVHLNDSKNPLGSRKDRHEVLDGGHIGLKALAAFTNHPAVRELPFCLETPNELPGYAREIAMLKQLHREE